MKFSLYLGHSVEITEFYSQKFRQINSFDLYINHKSCRLISRNICHVWVIFCVLYTVYIWLYCHHKETWSLLLPINSRKISCLRERLDISSDVFLFLETFLLDKKSQEPIEKEELLFLSFNKKGTLIVYFFQYFIDWQKFCDTQNSRENSGSDGFKGKKRIYRRWM